MAGFDGTAFGEEIVTVVRGFVERSLGPLVERIAKLEALTSELHSSGANQHIKEDSQEIDNPRSRTEPDCQPGISWHRSSRLPKPKLRAKASGGPGR